MTGSPNVSRTAAALAIGALIVSVVALVVASGEQEPPRRWGEPPEQSRAERQRVAQLEERVAALERSMASLDRTAPAAGSSTASGSEDLATRVALLESMLGSDALAHGLAAEGPPAEVLAEAELDRTRRAVAEIRRQELAAKIEDWVGRELDRSDVVLAALADKVPMSNAERARVRELFASEAEAYGELLDELYTGPEPTNAGEEELLGERWDHAVVTMKELRVTRDTELESLLGAERMDTLRQIVKAVERRPAAGANSEKP